MAGAQQALQTRELQGLVNMAGVGRNLGAMSMQSLGQAASNAARREIQDAQFKNQIDANYGRMVGDVVGYGIDKGLFGGGGGGNSYGPINGTGSWFPTEGVKLGYGGGGI